MDEEVDFFESTNLVRHTLTSDTVERQMQRIIANMAWSAMKKPHLRKTLMMKITNFGPGKKCDGSRDKERPKFCAHTICVNNKPSVDLSREFNPSHSKNSILLPLAIPYAVGPSMHVVSAHIVPLLSVEADIKDPSEDSDIDEDSMSAQQI